MADDERDKWLTARAAAKRGDGRAPAIESCTLVPRAEGGFEVVIRGRALRSGAVPPHILVGDRLVRSVRGEGGGTVLRGIVDAASAGEPVEVDLGPGGRVSGVAETAGGAR